jgi:hypothetical protein
VARSNTTAGSSGQTQSSNLPEGWEEWPTFTQAANLIGISRKRLSELVRDRGVKKIIGPRGALGGFRLDPSDVETLESVLELESDEDTQAVAVATPSMGEVVRSAVDGAKQAQAHAERLVTLFDGPYKFVLDTLRAENESLRAELVVMRKERAELELQRESARSTRALEDLALVELKSEASTKAEAVDLLKRLGSAMMAKHMGVDPRHVALKEAVESIPRESFEVLFKMGVLPPEAEAKLKMGLDWKDEPVSNGAAS